MPPPPADEPFWAHLFLVGKRGQLYCFLPQGSCEGGLCEESDVLSASWHWPHVCGVCFPRPPWRLSSAFRAPAWGGGCRGEMLPERPPLRTSDRVMALAPEAPSSSPWSGDGPSQPVQRRLEAPGGRGRPSLFPPRLCPGLPASSPSLLALDTLGPRV